MFINNLYSLAELSAKLGLPAKQVEAGLRNVNARPLTDSRKRVRYAYEAAWNYVHREINRQHYAAWEHEEERVDASELTAEVIARITLNWPEETISAFERILRMANGSRKVVFMLHKIRRIDPECPACGHFPWIAGYDGRQADSGVVLSIYVCPKCGYLFCRRL